jgi:AraC-like DNA-binding protein
VPYWKNAPDALVCAKEEKMPLSPTEDPRELLQPRLGAKAFELARYAPSEDLTGFVLRYWLLRWDLNGQEPHSQEALLPPCVNLVIEPGRSRIYGVVSSKTVQRLEGHGQVFGVKFRPGGFYPFLRGPVSALTDRSIEIAQIFGADAAALEADILAQSVATAMIAVMEQFLRAHLPAWNGRISTINTIVERIIDDRSIRKVDDLLVHTAYSKRSLQRLFSEYVGVSPKWVIRRYRLYEAAERTAAGGRLDWSQLALELGYYDQAHFIRDFKSVVGKTPEEYAAYSL